MNESPLSSMPFPAASAFWLEQHSRYIKPNTMKNYAGALKVLRPFFGEILLRDITIADIRRYQDERGKKAGAYLLNSEVCVLQMVLKEARCWKPIADLYKPLKVPKRRGGHSISADEERILREVAFSRPKWRLAAHCMLVMLSTTMGFGELRHIRRRDVDLKKRSLLVRDGAKNFYRDRTIPMNAAAYESKRAGAARRSLGRFGESADVGARNRDRAGRLLPAANTWAVSEVESDMKKA